jgi:hypothetical protein
MKLLSDNPISNEEEDDFEFSPFVEILGDIINDTKILPFTVGIFGEWGSGKTSLLKLLQKWLEKMGFITVWFNPWKYDNKEELWAALIRSILLEIHAQTPDKELKEAVWALLRSASWITFKKGISFATKGLVSERNIEKMKNAVVNQSKIEHEFLNKFENKFSDAVKAYVGDTGKLIIFIDDLDRCIPENAITVLESLKLYLDNSLCVFVLGMDRTIVEVGIRHRYGKEINISGREYLEKIVQLPFFLPPVQFGKLQETLISQSDAASYPPEIWSLIRYGLGGNPRKAKRFVNSFYLAQEALKRPEIIGETLVPIQNGDYADDPSNEAEHQLFYLAKILIIQMNFSEFYDYLLYNPNGLKLWEEKYPVLKDGRREEIELASPELLVHLENRRLNFFMERSSGSDFPQPPSSSSLERILRFTGLVERSMESDEMKYKKDKPR